MAETKEPAQAATQLVPISDSTEALLMRAVESGASVDTMERLMAMRRELRDEAAKEAFFRDLAAFQAACPVIVKSRKVYNKGGQSERYRYASMEDIIRVVGPLLKDNGLSYRIDTSIVGESPRTFAARCIVHHVAGHSESSEFCVPVDNSGRMNAAQEYGSAGTYAKRYAFCNALGILTGDEDDDARGSGKRSSGTSTPPKPRPQTPAPTPRNPDPQTTQIKVEDVRQTQTQSGRTIYRILADGGEWYRTWSKSTAELAKQHKGTGELLICDWRDTDWGKQVDKLIPIADPSAAKPAADPPDEARETAFDENNIPF